MLATAPTGGSGDGALVWSDRKEAKEGVNITSIKIEKHRNGLIARIRTR